MIKQIKKKPWSVEKKLAFACLLLNITAAPGIGTFLWGLKKLGIKQLVLSIIGMLMMLFGKAFTIIGSVVIGIAWIWSVMTGIKIMKDVR